MHMSEGMFYEVVAQILFLYRSLCSVAAKWTYTKVEVESGGFSKDFYSKIGLSDLTEKNFQKIGN